MCVCGWGGGVKYIMGERERQGKMVGVRWRKDGGREREARWREGERGKVEEDRERQGRGRERGKLGGARDRPEIKGDKTVGVRGEEEGMERKGQE